MTSRKNNNALLLIGLAVAGVLYARSQRPHMIQPAGSISPLQTIAKRYNNPLNIKFNPGNNWVGQDTARSGQFVYFTAPEFGYRAAFVLLKNYIGKGFNTLETVINRWAPPSDNNNTRAYIDFVSQRTTIWPNTPMVVGDYKPVIEAMAIFEGGEVDLNALEKGYKLAFG